VATNRIIETGGPTSMPIGVIADGQHLIRLGATIVGANDMILVSKTTTETIVSSTTLHDDATLLFPMLANKTYRFMLSAFFDTIAVADFKCRHSGPASPNTVRIFRYSVAPDGTAFADIRVDVAYSSADIVVAGAGTQGGNVYMDGIISNGPNAGDFRFSWAQNNSNAGNTSVLAGSHLEYRKVS
jgi:hypothetical protein